LGLVQEQVGFGRGYHVTVLLDLACDDLRAHSAVLQDDVGLDVGHLPHTVRVGAAHLDFALELLGQDVDFIDAPDELLFLGLGVLLLCLNVVGDVDVEHAQIRDVQAQGLQHLLAHLGLNVLV